MKNKKTDIIIYIMLAAVLLHLIIIYPKLPSTVPVHWNIQGEIDVYGNKSMLWVVYGVAWIMHIVLLVVPQIDPRKANYIKFERFYGFFRLVMVAFMLFMTELTIKASFNAESIKMEKITPLIVSVIIIFLGNYMPKCKHNYTFGIRTPWTLASEKVWNKTHRFSGPVWIICGTISLLSVIFIKNTTIYVAVSLTSLLSLVIISAVYSYIIFRKEEKQ